MKKIAITALTLLAIGAGSVLPACADDNKEMMHNAAMFPVRALGMGTALVVGTPIAVTRRVSNRVIGITSDFADKIGGKDNFPPVAGAAILGVPFGIIVGTGEGLYYGGKNAISHSVEKPFSSASFSLEEME